MEEEHELSSISTAVHPAASAPSTDVDAHANNMSEDQLSARLTRHEALLDRQTVRKLDLILLPFLALLFLFNSLDRANIGNAETANFTADIGLDKHDLNTAIAVFFAFFVALQPVGAAFGRKYGMARWVPGCMAVWGLCTALHIWVRARWQLILLRAIIGMLEAGFYPVTVSYLSLFYTRYEFGRRLALFYGQYAVAGALGGVLSFAVFSRFPKGDADRPVDGTHWRPWQVLFLIEGCATILLAFIGFLWLPHRVETVWFLNREEQEWAKARVSCDRQELHQPSKADDAGPEEEDTHPSTSEEAERLMGHGSSSFRGPQPVHLPSYTTDTGLSTTDILSAFLDWKILYLLAVNILSALPTTAFAIFLPLVLQPLAPSSPALTNLLTVPPFLCGAAVLYAFTHWSDKTHQRIVPILAGLGLTIIGLLSTALLPTTVPALRYFALCILLSGMFIASPLTVVWLTNNIPNPGKRAMALGINGWGNLAGVFSALLFAPKYAPGYTTPLAVTCLCVAAAWMGYAAFGVLLVRENRRRRQRAVGLGQEQHDSKIMLKLRDWIRESGATGTRFVEAVEEVVRRDENEQYLYGL